MSKITKSPRMERFPSTHGAYPSDGLGWCLGILAIAYTISLFGF